MILAIGLFALVASASALYSPSDAVVELTANNFDSKVKNSDELWIVEFYAPWCGHCKSLAPEYKKAANALKGIVNIGAVDADAHNSLGGQYGVKGFPTIKVFGANKNSPEDYNGQRTAQGIVDVAMGKLKTLVNQRMSGGGRSSGGSSGGSGGGGGGSGGAGSKEDVIVLTDSNFDKLVYGSEDMWLVEFFAPWCGHCKNLEPHWQSAASQLKGKVKVATVDATENQAIAQKFGVRGYPTIKYFPAGKKSGPSDVEDYDGGRTAADIVAWASDKHSVNLPPPEVKQLLNAEQMKTVCEGNQLCVIAFMPHILDCQSACRKDYIKIMTGMADKYKKRQWGYLWAEGGSQPDLEDAVGIGGFGYPAMAAINTRKMKYAWLRGAFSETGVNEFLRDLSMGRGSTAPVKNNDLPKITTAEPWDGKDGEMPVEEDYDLSDVELDDLDDVKEEL